MKRYRILLYSALMMLGIISCRKDELPSDPVRMFPITNLTVTVGGTDYLAIPKMNADATFNDTLTLSVAEGQETGIVKTLRLADETTTINIQEGQTITFVEDVFDVICNEGRTDEQKYVLYMAYEKPSPIPEFLYMTKSTDADGGGNKNWLNPDDLGSYPTLYPKGGDSLFEGHFHFDASQDWANLSFVRNDLVSWFDHETWGLAGTTSYGKTDGIRENVYEGTDNCFPSNGIWGGWAAGSGVWMFRLDVTALTLEALRTEWSISGSAAGSTPVNMEYSVEDGTWKATASLDAGTFRFVTVPATEGDLILTYGGTNGNIEDNGAEIPVEEAGDYVITLDLSSAPNYKYSVVKEGEEAPLPQMYLTNTFIKGGPNGSSCYIDPNALDKYPSIASADEGSTYEGYVNLSTGELTWDWGNMSIVDSDLKTYYTNESEGIDGVTTSYGSFSLTQKESSTEEPNNYPTGGLWGPWGSVGDNVWRVRLDKETSTAEFLAVRWQLQGSATSAVDMSINAGTCTWSASVALTPGTVSFVTTPLNEGDPVVTLGLTDGELTDGGEGIEISEAGNYTVSLDLSDPMRYSYSITKV